MDYSDELLPDLPEEEDAISLAVRGYYANVSAANRWNAKAVRIKEELLKDPKYVEALANEKLYREAAVAARASLDALAIMEYEATGNKRPHADVSVKVFKKLVYDDSSAFSYCKDHYANALKLDKTAFERYALAMKELGSSDELKFVSFNDDPRVNVKGLKDTGEDD